MGLTVRWRNMAAVLKDALPIGLAVGGVTLAIMVGWFLSTTPSAAVRYTGMILQIAGLSTVAIGLRRMRQRFGRPSVKDKVSDWFRRLAATFVRPKSHTIEISTGDYVVVGTATELDLARGVGLGASLENRVSALEEKVNRLRDKLDTKVQEVRGELATAKESIQRESAERQAAHKEMTHTIEDVAVGGLHLEMVGLFWLFCGIIGTSIPHGIAALLLRFP